LGVELHGKAARVTGGLRAVAAADDGGETDGDIRLFAGFLKELGAGVLAGGFIADLAGRFEVTVTDESAGMDDAFRNAFAVEVADLLEELVVFEGRRPARADGALLLVVVDRVALTVGKRAVFAHCNALMGR